MLLDYWLGSDTALEFLHALGGRHGRLPVIMLTGHSNHDIQRLGQNAGAVSFVSKDDVSANALDTVIQSTLHTHRLEGELLAAINERDAALREQFDMLADIVRNVDKPLQGVGDAADAIARLSGQTRADQAIAEQAQSVQDNALLLRKTIRRLIELVHVEQPHIDLKLELVDLRDLVDKATRLVSRQMTDREQSLEFGKPDEGVPVKADRTAILQALLNIIANAGKFSPRGRRIVIELTVERGDAVVTVTDQGPGMSAREIEAALQPLPRRPLHGDTGMGLSIASGIAELHGGRVSIESEPGRGSRVALTVPLCG